MECVYAKVPQCARDFCACEIHDTKRAECMHLTVNGMNTHACTHIYTCMHAHTYTHACTHIYTCMHAHTYTHAYMHIYTHTHAHTYTHTRMHTHACTHILYKYTNTYPPTHTHPHTHIHTHAHLVADTGYRGVLHWFRIFIEHNEQSLVQSQRG